MWSQGARAQSREPGQPGRDAGSRAASTSGRPAEGEEQQSLLERITAPFKEIAMRGTVYTSFIFAKQPKRIRQVSSGTLHGNTAALHMCTAKRSTACPMLQL